MGTRAGAFVQGTFALAAVLAAAFLLPASASATIFSGTVQDESGDGPDPTRDLKSSTASYDNAQGSISFEVRLQAEPASDLQVTTALGRRSTDGTCGTPLLLLGAFLPDGSTIWLIERDGTSPAEEQDDADRTVSGALVKLRAKDPRLKGFHPNCAETILSDPDQPDTVYDSVNSFDVKPPPPKPKLKASISRVGSLKRGAAKAVKVRIKNTGKAAAKKVVVRAAVKGTARLTPRVRKLGTIRPGKSKIARFRVKVKSRGKGKVTISARATGRKVKARAATSFHVRVPQPPPPPSSPGLAGKIFWGFENYQWDRSADVTFLHFTNRSYVRWGVPKGGLKNCGRVTAKLKDGEMQPGCLRYSYNARTGQVRIGKVRGTYRKGKLKLKMDSDVWETDGESWELGLTAKPGTRFKTKLINRGYYGACGVTPYCTTWAEYLQLTLDGRFGRQDSSITTGGTPGVSFIAISKLGPNQRGRYRVLSGGRIRFNYASGKKATETLIVQTNKRGRPDPVHEGLLLNDTWFYREDD